MEITPNHYAYEAITVADTAIGFTAALLSPVGALQAVEWAMVSVETASIRFTLDGTTPTSTVGHLLADSDILVLTGLVAIRQFRAIRATGSSASIKVTYGWR